MAQIWMCVLQRQKYSYILWNNTKKYNKIQIISSARSVDVQKIALSPKQVNLLPTLNTI